MWRLGKVKFHLSVVLGKGSVKVKVQFRVEAGYDNLPFQSWAPGISRPDLSDACNDEYDLDPSDPENVKRASLLRLYHITEKSNQNLLTSLCSNCPSVTNLSNLESLPRTQQNVLLRHSNILEHDLGMTTISTGKIRVIATSTDKRYSLESHQQQFFSELPSPGRWHKTNYRYS